MAKKTSGSTPNLGMSRSSAVMVRQVPNGQSRGTTSQVPVEESKVVPPRLPSKTESGAALQKLRVKRSELIFFTTQLAVMLDSGVVLTDALDAISQQSAAGSFKTIIKSVSEKVKNGQSFSVSLTSFPAVFNSMFVSMVKASEASGKMVQMLQTLSEHIGFEHETRRQIKAALTYPLVVMLMTCFAVSVMMFFVLPKFAKIYEAKGVALPKITQSLLYLSLVLRDGRKMMSVATVLLLGIIAAHYWIGTVSGRRIMDFVKIRMPILGTMFVNLVVTRSMRIMATMINTGVNLLDAIDVIRGSCNNYYFQQLWSATDKNIRDGYQLSESIEKATGRWQTSRETSGLGHLTADERKAHLLSSCGCASRLISPAIVHMLAAGEKSGRLGQVSDKISVFYGKKLEASIKNVTALMEPLVIVVLGTIIGFIAIALLLPVFKMSHVITR